MRSISKLIVIGAGVLLCSQTCTVSYAQGYWGPRHGWGVPYPFDYNGYATGRIPTPPYFAIHPPVYYGTRVGMTYGDSPVTHLPRGSRPTGAMIYNSHIQTVSHPQSHGKVIPNPYCLEAKMEETKKVSQATLDKVVQLEGTLRAILDRSDQLDELDRLATIQEMLGEIEEELEEELDELEEDIEKIDEVLGDATETIEMVLQEKDTRRRVEDEKNVSRPRNDPREGPPARIGPAKRRSTAPNRNRREN